MRLAFSPQSAARSTVHHDKTALVRSTRARACTRAALGLALAGLVGLSGCSTIEAVPIPFITKRGPDLTNGRASAENMVRLDAAMRSGCDVVDNIERPPPKKDPRDPAPQRWVARTCHGDIAYDVTTTQGSNGPAIKVTPVPGPIDRPANTHFIPAGMDDAAPADTSGAAAGSSQDVSPGNATGVHPPVLTK